MNSSSPRRMAAIFDPFLQLVGDSASEVPLAEPIPTMRMPFPIWTVVPDSKGSSDAEGFFDMFNDDGKLNVLPKSLSSVKFEVRYGFYLAEDNRCPSFKEGTSAGSFGQM